MPDNIYANIETNRMGDEISYDDVCPNGCVQLQEDKKQNILGRSRRKYTSVNSLTTHTLTLQPLVISTWGPQHNVLYGQIYNLNFCAL